jgi:hypothetical protein
MKTINEQSTLYSYMNNLRLTNILHFLDILVNLIFQNEHTNNLVIQKVIYLYINILTEKEKVMLCRFVRLKFRNYSIQFRHDINQKYGLKFNRRYSQYYFTNYNVT